MKSITKLALIGLLLASRLYLQPIYSLVSDCDETFNYWEPLNFLLRGFGKQTWEYSPEYSIRSWAFLLPLYTSLLPIGKLCSVLGLPPYVLFYVARSILGLYSVVMEWHLYRELEATLSLQTANMWLLFQIFNPGWFHASVELLPSSFAMVTMLGFAKYGLRYLSTGSDTAFIQALLFNFVSGILGWPFVLILSVPLVAHYVITHRIFASIKTGFGSLLRLLAVIVVVFCIDSIYYGKVTPVAWNIVMYNVVDANEKSGPNIFGVEPWYYYFLNLLLNFPITVLVGCLVGLATNFRLASIWGSLLVWMAIFVQQPHKEERFLYPIYSIISLSASVGFTKVWGRLSGSKGVRNTFFFGLYALTICQSSMRTFALIKNYTAPLDAYAHIPIVPGPQNVCVGREWFHYPTSMFLSNDYRLHFIQSGFDGLLPGDFKETHSMLNSIREIPVGMNNENKFDPSKLTPVDQCDFYIDFMLPTEESQDALDPNEMGEEWKLVYRTPFVDASQSKFLGRAFSAPEFLLKLVPGQKYWSRVYEVNFLDYCVFERQTEQV
ncbi:LANO_0H04808g1_1 [Lachancea nothofagi CBS 11611]|uniref:Mannosyltransferase n=1 Tax=Lachancea nothofagi CBS 11611 TaxID=1266666 RepID=A0A1G4KLM0_9SACH|nr:LANO_0H04808g1_1 [Lachancea nothofagi CBS 11611]